MEQILTKTEIQTDQVQGCPLISVIIPVYNVEKYLRECVDSVINQTYSFIEIILIDDGSTDLSGQICDVYMTRDSRIKVNHQENHGLGHARNVGMRLATGKYIIFLDSDDYWRVDTLEGLVKKAEDHNLQVAVFSAQPFLDGIEHYKGPSYSHSVQNDVVKNGTESFLCASSNGEYYAQACLRMYRLDYLRDNGFQFDEGIIHEDESFSFLAYIHADRVESTGERYYYRRYRPGSIMMSCSHIQSAHGHRTAAETLLRYMCERDLNQAQRELYKRKILGYIFAVYHQYWKAKEETGNRTDDSSYDICSGLKSVDDIAVEMQRTIRLARGTIKGLSLRHRLALLDFPVGYWIWRGRVMMRQGGLFVGRLRRTREGS